MTRYLLRVYRDTTYYPDMQLHSHSLGRLERRAKQLEREGYRVKLLATTADGEGPLVQGRVRCRPG